MDGGRNVPVTKPPDGFSVSLMSVPLFPFLQGVEKFLLHGSGSVCKSKCSHCCRIPVQITELEAQYISKHTERKIQVSRQPLSSSVLESSCPFLDKNELCSIYEVRPFNCRTFHTLDNPNFCKDPNFPHIVYGCAEFEYGSDILRELRDVTLSLNVSLRPRLPLADIRDFF